MAQAGQSREDLISGEVFVDALVRQSLVLFLVGLHLSNEVDEVLWLGEKLELLGVDQIVQLPLTARLVLDLNDHLDDIQAVETVVLELAVHAHACLLSGAEVVLNHGQNVSLNLVVSLQSQCIIFGALLPQGDLISGLNLSRDEVSRGIQVKVLLEHSSVTLVNKTFAEVLSINATAEAGVLSIGTVSFSEHGSSSSNGEE